MKIIFDGALVLLSGLMWFFRRDVLSEEGLNQTAWQAARSGRSVHFHAASVGELEILVPVIREFSNRRQNSVEEKREDLVLTVFSPSAKKSMLKLLNEGLVQFAYFSPQELDWQKFYRQFNIKKTIISKYEAWPGLWAAISHHDVPLILLQAQFRTSLVWVVRILNFFHIQLPRVWFFTSAPHRAEALLKFFPRATIQPSIDPRWAQVLARSQKINPRVELLKKITAACPHPFGVIGSAWLEDLQILSASIKAMTPAQTIFVVPHSLDAENILKIEALLRSWGHVSGPNWVRSSTFTSESKNISVSFILVDEMGFLAELYSIADWAWVGGGLGEGIHSTLEPAFYGLPIGCGPKNAEKFLEVEIFQTQGQLTICHDSTQAALFIKGECRSKFTATAMKPDTIHTGLMQLVEECQRIR